MTSTIAIILTEKTLKAALVAIGRKRRDDLAATGKTPPKFALQVIWLVVAIRDDYKPDNLQIDIVRDVEPVLVPLSA